jgi:hypothetical protein
MNSAVETRNLRYEYYVQIDGKVTAGYRAFADALKAGLLLKQLSPHSNIKVRDADEQLTTEFIRAFAPSTIGLQRELATGHPE